VNDDSTSAELVKVYNEAVALGTPPRLSVAKYFCISIKAAASRIYRARKRGLIKPWTGGGTARVVDEGALIGVVTTGRATSHPVRPAQPTQKRIDRIDATDRAAMRKALDEGKGCQHCGGLHTRACPRVRRLVYHPNGMVAEVEFFPPDVWSDNEIIWPEDLETDDDDGS
jgi:hypothetical protein